MCSIESKSSNTWGPDVWSLQLQTIACNLQEYARSLIPHSGDHDVEKHCWNHTCCSALVASSQSLTTLGCRIFLKIAASLWNAAFCSGPSFVKTLTATSTLFHRPLYTYMPVCWRIIILIQSECRQLHAVDAQMPSFNDLSSNWIAYSVVPWKADMGEFDRIV